MPLNLPNLLTWLRILLIPLIVVVLYLPRYLILPLETANRLATIFFVVAAITDWFDGYLARKLNQTSAFGAFLDPVADKLMVTAALIVLVDLGRTASLVALIIIGREIAISALREWMAKAGKSGSVAVSFIGKLKTGFQMVAIAMLLYWQPLGGIPKADFGQNLINLAALLTLISMFYYLRVGGQALAE